jgi:hypothetical protein
MSLALSSQAAHHRLRTKQLYLNAQASGNYIPGGDLLNLQAISSPTPGAKDNTVGYPGNISDYAVISAPPGFSGNLVKGATLSTWGLQVFETAAAEPDGVPLGLGTLSAAASNSTYTAAGLVTVLTTTPPPLGSFIVLSNGASGKGIFFDGVMVQVTAVVPGVSYSFQFGQGTSLAYASAVDTLKWQQVQASATNPLQAVALAAPITGVLATANLLTITQANSLQVGQFVYLGGTFKTASVYASGAIVQVASATATGWTANWQGTIIAQTSNEVATSALLVTNGGAPVTAYPYSGSPTALITNSLAVAADATHAGLLTLTAAQAYQAGMLIAVQGVGANTSLNGTIATVITTSLTQATIKANGWGAIANTSAETAGYASVLATGASASATGELPAAAYPAGALVAPFVIMVEGAKGQI